LFCHSIAIIFTKKEGISFLISLVQLTDALEEQPAALQGGFFF